MLFISKNYKNPIPSGTKYPILVLHDDTWDDFGYQITYHVMLYESYDNQHELGDIKILTRDTEKTTLNQSFTKLSDDQCSLGQSLEFYTQLKKYLPDTFPEILKSLNDIATNHGLAEAFKDERGYRDALFRFSAAEKAFEEAALLLFENKRKVNESLVFKYSIQLDGATAPHEVDFDFAQDSDMPYRVNVIIGKNGTGKTRLLGSMVESISGISKKESFSPYNPLFNKVIAISYSLFDDFPKPPNTTVFNYKYIGLRSDEEEMISDERLGNKLRTALKLILKNDREVIWFDMINQIIPLSHLGLKTFQDLDDAWIGNISYEQAKRLSSGQSILLFIMTELIAHIEPQSLILFDEPETHLHPSAIAALMNKFYDILNRFESYAIISTHSPLIIQDVPSKYVNVFDRIDNLPIIRKLGLESFGENISELTSTAFGTVSVEELYKRFLKRLLDNNFGSADEVNKKFNNNLSFNAQLYLAALEQQNEKS